MRLVYMAHPFGGDPENLLRAKSWLRWAADKARRQGAFVVAPWIPLCETHSDSDSKLRAFMLDGDCETVRRCDALWLVGPFVSAGMARERDAAVFASVPVYDMTGMDFDDAWNALGRP